MAGKAKSGGGASKAGSGFGGGGDEGGFGSGAKKGKKPKAIREPIGLICYICGMKFGSTSLKIHIPQCEKKWIDREAQKPKRERKPVPKPPQEMKDMEIKPG